MSRTKSKIQAVTLGGTADEVEAAFYESLRLGELEPLMACWADEDDIACIHPGGTRLLGGAPIRAAFESMFANGGAIPITAVTIGRIDSLTSSVHHVLERVDMLTPKGPEQAYVLATNVYHQTAQGWRLVVHHASPGSAGPGQDRGQTSKVLH